MLSGGYSYTAADYLQHNTTCKVQVLSKELFSYKGSTASSATSFGKKVKKSKKSAAFVLFFVLFAIFILHSRESELYRYILDGKSALAWELPFSRFMSHLSST